MGVDVRRHRTVVAAAALSARMNGDRGPTARRRARNPASTFALIDSPTVFPQPNTHPRRRAWAVWSTACGGPSGSRGEALSGVASGDRLPTGSLTLPLLSSLLAETASPLWGCLTGLARRTHTSAGGRALLAGLFRPTEQSRLLVAPEDVLSTHARRRTIAICHGDRGPLRLVALSRFASRWRALRWPSDAEAIPGIPGANIG